MSSAAASTSLTSRTEADPAYGAVTVGEGSHEIAYAQRWFEDGMHVVQSIEFDVWAEHPDAGQVIGVFLDNLFEHRTSLVRLVEQDEATDDERDELERLNARFVEIFQAEQEYELQQRKKRDLVIKLRKRGEHSGKWQQRATAPQGSSLLSNA